MRKGGKSQAIAQHTEQWMLHTDCLCAVIHFVGATAPQALQGCELVGLGVPRKIFHFCRVHRMEGSAEMLKGNNWTDGQSGLV